MTKKIFFDMDGTIADLYGQEKWLEQLLSETVGLFRNLPTMHNKKELADTLQMLKNTGFELEVITWTPKNVSSEYEKIVAQEKAEWVAEHFPQISKIHALRYGTPKQKANYTKAKTEILVDDNEEVLKIWETPKQRKYIKADNNLIKNLQALI